MESFPFFFFFSFPAEEIICMCSGAPVPPGRWSWTSLCHSGGKAAVGQHGRCCPGGRSQRRKPTERSLGHQCDSGWHLKKEPAGTQPDSFLAQFKIISGKGGKIAKVSLKNNTKPHFPLIFLREGQKFLPLENNYSKCNAISFPFFVQVVHLRTWRARTK